MKLGFALLPKRAFCVLSYATLTPGALSIEIFLLERNKTSIIKAGGSCLEANANYESS